MIRYSAVLYLVDPDEKSVQHKSVVEDNPTKAAKLVARKDNSDIGFRSAEVGDCVAISSPTGKTHYMIYDLGMVPLEVSMTEFQLWRKMMATNPTRKLGISKAMPT